MELQEQALHFCKHIETLTKAHCTMLDLPAASFCIPPFRCNCALKNGECDAYQTHLYGSYEAERWDGNIFTIARVVWYLLQPRCVRQEK